MWSDGAISFSGVPFVIIGSKTLDCHFGKDRNLRIKQRKLIKVIIVILIISISIEYVSNPLNSYSCESRWTIISNIHLFILFFLNSKFGYSIFQETENPCKNRRLSRASVKQGCPCQVFMKEIIHFPEYTVTIKFLL